MSVVEGLGKVRARIAAAALGAQRDPHDVTLIGVCKRQPFANIVAACNAGLSDLGENTAQGLQQTAAALQGLGIEVRWHFIGRLQRNKINAVLRYSQWIHSVDSAELADGLSKRSQGRQINVLIQVNEAKEAQKGGVSVEEVLPLAESISEMPGLCLRGLMTIPPTDKDPKPYFDMLSELRRELRASPWGGHAEHLSMGMSGDYEAAVVAGTTMVRVGTAIFGERVLANKQGAISCD